MPCLAYEKLKSEFDFSLPRQTRWISQGRYRKIRRAVFYIPLYKLINKIAQRERVRTRESTQSRVNVPFYAQRFVATQSVTKIRGRNGKATLTTRHKPDFFMCGRKTLALCGADAQTTHSVGKSSLRAIL